MSATPPSRTAADAGDPAGGYLARKAERVRRALAEERADPARSRERVEEARERALGAPPPLSLRDRLTAGPTVALVAEFKRRSPSGGPLAPDGGAVDVARAYRDAGAAAVSVLTDPDDFGGHLEDLAAVARAVPLPALRKDFILDERQLYETRAAGGSAALLIMAMLADADAVPLLRAAAEVGLECVVEVHDTAELERAVGLGATLIGINNRDLQRLTTDLAVTERLATRAPDGVVLVSESGIRTADDVARARDAGVHAVLVGESLLRLPLEQRFALARELASVPRRPVPGPALGRPSPGPAPGRTSREPLDRWPDPA